LREAIAGVTHGFADDNAGFFGGDDVFGGISTRRRPSCDGARQDMTRSALATHSGMMLGVAATGKIGSQSGLRAAGSLLRAPRRGVMPARGALHP